MDDQIPLFVDTYHDALRHTIEAMGGFKRVGSEMRPDLDVVAAGRWLSDCCNPEKREKLALTELALLRRRARQAGINVLAAYEMREAGYVEPVPMNPLDEAAQLQRDFISAVDVLKVIQARMARASA